MAIFKIHHITKYQYDRSVSESVNEIRIFPFQCKEQELLQHELIITNQPDVHVFNDYWGNKTGAFNLLEPHQELTIESKLLIRTTMQPDLHLQYNAGFEKLKQETQNQLQLIELMTADTIEGQSKIDEICSLIFNEQKSIAQIVGESSEYIFNNFTYTKGITTIETTVDEILTHKEGVCQDFAHVLLQILRTLDIPCRYVSGYICPNKNGMRGEGATHAWVEAWIPEFGWMGIDPTNNVWVSNNHVKLAVGRNFGDCTPVKGTFKGPSRQDLFVFVSVGYEDGQFFEETTHVQMQKQEKQDDEEIKVELFSTFAGQQQQ